MYIGAVHNGEITYNLATMEKSSPAAQTPYARVGEDGVVFAGPHSANVPVGPVRVVLFGPGAQEIVKSSEVESELRAQDAKGRKWTLLPVDSQQNWGAASTQLVHDLMDEHALAIVALDRAASHLSEQLALKSFVPVIALSNDKSLTAANIPWIFRLPPGTSPAAALRLLEQAVAHVGANSEKVRDLLASGNAVSGWRFFSTGELAVATGQTQ
jgi:branched-chain amino acid transport system substrate-binding protein